MSFKPKLAIKSELLVYITTYPDLIPDFSRSRLALRLYMRIVRGVRASALTKEKPRMAPGLRGKEIKMIAVIEILIFLR